MANDPNTIQYVIQEDGFWYVASKDRTPGVPEITVSSKGVANGLSEKYNDGFLFGPDTYNPSSTATPPYTQTSGIQEAGNYLATNGYGEIKVKSGNYILNATVNITTPGIMINGEITRTGQKTGIDPPSPLPTIKLADNINEPLFLITSDPSNITNSPDGFRGFQLKNLIIDGNSANNTGANGIEIAAADVIIENCEIKKASNNGIVTFDTSTVDLGENVRLVNTTVHNNGSNGVLVGHGDLRILGGEYFNNDGAGIAGTGGNMGGFQVLNANIYGNSTGIYISGATGQFINNGYIMGCSIDHNYQYGIYINSNIVQFIIANNTIWDTTAGNSTPPTTASHIYLNESYGNIQALITGNTFFADSSATYLPQEIYAVNGYSHAIFTNNYYYNTNRTVIISNYLLVTTPSVPASATAQQNTNPYPVKVYVNGGALTEVQITIGSTTYTVYSNSTASAVYEGFTLPAGASITLTYTTAPTWSWVPE